MRSASRKTRAGRVPRAVAQLERQIGRAVPGRQAVLANARERAREALAGPQVGDLRRRLGLRGLRLGRLRRSPIDCRTRRGRPGPHVRVRIAGSLAAVDNVIVGRRRAGASLPHAGLRVRRLERRRRRRVDRAGTIAASLESAGRRPPRPRGVLRLPGKPPDDPPDGRPHAARGLAAEHLRRRADPGGRQGLHPDDRRRAQPPLAELLDGDPGRRRADGREDADQPRRPDRRRGPHPSRCRSRASPARRAWSRSLASAARTTRARPESSASSTTRRASANMPSASLWAAVPHYVAAVPNPKAALALLRRLEGLTGVALEASELEDAMERFEGQVNRAVSGQPGDRGAGPPPRIRARRRDRAPRGPLRRRPSPRLPALPEAAQRRRRRRRTNRGLTPRPR